MFSYLIIGWAGILGLLLGGAMARAISRKLVQQARQRAAQRLEEAQEQAALTLREMKARAREESLALRKANEEHEQRATKENALLAERIKRLEARHEKLEAELSVRQAEHERRQRALVQAKGTAADLRHEAKERRHQARELVEQRADRTAKQTSAQMVDAMVLEHRAQCEDRLRNLEATDGEEFNRQAKRLMGIAMGRHGGRHTAERRSFVVQLGDHGADLLIEHPEYAEIVEQEAGVRWTVAESGATLRIEGGDGVARELARRSVVRMLSNKPFKDPQQLVRNLSDELQKELKVKGKEAFRILGLKPAHHELVMLVGRLAYRTSYTQNQWEHAIEASFMAGLMAAELGLDVITARRGTLLHDIGKALSHEIEGSHAVIGAELARKHGETEVVANAIGSHHGDEPVGSPYALLVASADAMSGARPGARREIIETYGDRIGDLERIATRFSGVNTVHAVQAGRELRVHVDERKVNDQRAATLADEIAAKVSDELTFPGQIRVIVIREFRAVDMAS